MPDYTITIRMKGEDAASTQIKQVSGSIKELGEKSEQATQKTSGVKGAIGQFKNELLGMATAIGAVKFAQFLGDMNELGMQVNASRNTFTELSGGAEQASINLQSMQEATRGVVDNMTLMNGANRLLLMGLASTGEEAASLAGGAVALGKAMGRDAGSAVADFAALLANRSIPRLDNFGISAANVRVRIDELKAAGYGIEEAFNMAVLAEMQVSMDKLGGSLDANATAFERWGVRIQNAVQDAGGAIAGGFEGVALGLEVLTGQDAGHAHLRGVAQEQATAYADAFIASMQGQLMNSDRGAVENYLQELFYRQMSGGAVDVGSMLSTQQGAALFSSGVDAAGLMARQQGILQIAASWDVSTAAAAEYQDRISAVAQASAYLEELDSSQMVVKPSTVMEASDALEAYWEQQAKQAQAADTLSGVVDGVAFQYNRWAQIGSTAFQTLSGLTDTWVASQDALAGSMAGISSAFTTMGLDPTAFTGSMMDFQLPKMPEFVSQTQLDAMNNAYQQAQLELQNIQSLAAQGLIPQNEVTKAQNMVSNLGTMVGQLETIQQLSDITGQTGGGILGELGNIVMAQAGALDTGLADQLQQQIDLASGKETASSVALSEQAAPLILAIAEQVGPEAAAAALQALEQNLETAKLSGMGDEQIAAMIPQFTGYAMGEGGQVQQTMDLTTLLAPIQAQMAAMQQSPLGGLIGNLFGGGAPGGEGGAAGATGDVTLSPTQEMAGMQEQLPVVTGLFDPLKTSAGEYALSLSEGRASIMQSISGVEELHGALNNLTGERTLKVRIEAIDPSGVLALAGTAGASLGQTVRDNGGTVPGRTPQIPE